MRRIERIVHHSWATGATLIMQDTKIHLVTSRRTERAVHGANKGSVPGHGARLGFKFFLFFPLFKLPSVSNHIDLGIMVKYLFVFWVEILPLVRDSPSQIPKTNPPMRLAMAALLSTFREDTLNTPYDLFRCCLFGLVFNYSEPRMLWRRQKIEFVSVRMGAGHIEPSFPTMVEDLRKKML